MGKLKILMIKTGRIVVIAILIILFWWVSPLYFMILYPVSSINATQSIDVYGEPIQIETNLEPFYFKDRSGRQIKIIPVAEYEIGARVAISRSYPNYFNVVEMEDILTNDMALVWGRFAEERIMKKMTFSHQWTYSGFSYKDSELNRELGLQYLSEHFSSNHTVSANKNIDNALRRVRKYDRVRIKGHLINLEIPGLPLVKSSLVRTDNWTPGEGNRGGSEFIYVTEFQNGKKVYK